MQIIVSSIKKFHKTILAKYLGYTNEFLKKLKIKLLKYLSIKNYIMNFKISE